MPLTTLLQPLVCAAGAAGALWVFDRRQRADKRGGDHDATASPLVETELAELNKQLAKLKARKHALDEQNP